MPKSPLRIVRSLLRRTKLSRDKAVVLESGLFDPLWYAARYRDVEASGLDPLTHFLTDGYSEGRDPGPGFNTSWYRAHNADVLASGANPLLHFITIGRAEGRAGVPAMKGPSLRVAPEKLPSGQSEDSLRIAAVVHLFYEDLAEELLDACLAIPGEFDILASVVSEKGEEAAHAWAAKRGFERLKTKRVPNRGRNVSSFTSAFGPRLLTEYDLFCHIHSKKSLHAGSEQTLWRQHSVGHLLGSEEHAAGVVRLFEENGTLGVLAPIPHKSVPYSGFTWHLNRTAVEKLMSKLGVQFRLDGYVDFPAGCMFWARSPALEQLLDGRIHYEDFPEEQGQNDGTLAHAVERSIYELATANGYDWAEIEGDSYWMNWSSKNIWQYAGFAHYPNLLSAIKSSQTISFDIFETLLTRTVPRDDLLGLVELQLDRRFNTATNFRRARKEAELKIRAASGDFDDIYREMSAGLARDVMEAAREAEFELECASSRPRSKVVDAFHYAVAEGKRVFLVSDTCLNREQVVHLLDLHRIKGHVELYLPSQTGGGADKVKQWEFLIDKERANSAGYLHVGHSEKSDIQMTHDRHIRSFHIMSASDLFDLSTTGHSLASDTNERWPLALGPVIATMFSDPFKVEYLC